MKQKLQTLIRQVRKERSKKRFLVEEVGENRWQLIIKKPVTTEKGVTTIEMDSNEMGELGFEVGIAQIDYENKRLYEGVKEQLIDKKGASNDGGKRRDSSMSGNLWYACKKKLCSVFRARRKLAGIHRKKEAEKN